MSIIFCSLLTNNLKSINCVLQRRIENILLDLEKLKNFKYVPQYEMIEYYRGKDKFTKPIFEYEISKDIDRIFIYNIAKLKSYNLKIEYKINDEVYITHKIKHNESFEIDFTKDETLKNNNGILYCKGFYIIEVVKDVK